MDIGAVYLVVAGVVALIVAVPWLIAVACQTIATTATETYGERAAPAGGFQVMTSATTGADAAATGFPLRYVVLHHAGILRPHFDLMFELSPGSRLATWRSPVWPLPAFTQVEALSAHRADYLTYEGPVSGDRGSVRRVAAGTCRVERQTEHEIALRTGDNVSLLLRRVGDSDQWLLEVGQTS